MYHSFCFQGLPWTTEEEGVTVLSDEEQKQRREDRQLRELFLKSIHAVNHPPAGTKVCGLNCSRV